MLGVADNLKEDVDVCTKLISLWMNVFFCLTASYLGHSKAATPQWATSLAFGSCSVDAIDAFRFGRLYRRCIDGGDGIRAFVYFVTAFR